MKTADYIAVAKKQNSITSDYALAKMLGTGPTTVCSWSNGRSVPDARFTMKLADLAHADPLEVLANIEIERAERTGSLEAAEFWRDRLQRISNGLKKQASKGIGTAITCLLAGSILITPDPVNASSISPMKTGEIDGGAHCILCKPTEAKRRRRRERRRSGAMATITRTLYGFSAHH